MNEKERVKNNQYEITKNEIEYMRKNERIRKNNEQKQHEK